MKYLRLFEQVDGPEIGDYVICHELYGEELSQRYTSNHVGQCVYYYDKEYKLFGDPKILLKYFIKYENLSERMREEFNATIHNLFHNKDMDIVQKFRDNYTIMCRNEIVYWSKSKEDCEGMIDVLKNSSKYNL